MMTDYKKDDNERLSIGEIIEELIIDDSEDAINDLFEISIEELKGGLEYLMEKWEEKIKSLGVDNYPSTDSQIVISQAIVNMIYSMFVRIGESNSQQTPEISEKIGNILEVYSSVISKENEEEYEFLYTLLRILPISMREKDDFGECLRILLKYINCPVNDIVYLVDDLVMQSVRNNMFFDSEIGFELVVEAWFSEEMSIQRLTSIFESLVENQATRLLELFTRFGLTKIFDKAEKLLKQEENEAINLQEYIDIKKRLLKTFTLLAKEKAYIVLPYLGHFEYALLERDGIFAPEVCKIMNYVLYEDVEYICCILGMMDEAAKLNPNCSQEVEMIKNSLGISSSSQNYSATESSDEGDKNDE